MAIPATLFDSCPAFGGARAVIGACDQWRIAPTAGNDYLHVSTGIVTP